MSASTPTWVQLVYLGCRGLLHPRAQGSLRAEDRPQRQPDRRVRGRGRVRGAVLLPRARPRAADPRRDRGRLDRRCLRRAPGADDADAADGGAVQRRRRWCCGAGRAARSCEHAERRRTPWFDLAATAFTIFVGSVSFAGSIVTFAKLQELMTSAPVVFPGPRRRLRARPWWVASRCPHSSCSTRRCGSASCSGVVGLVFGVLLVLPVGGADVPIVISLLNAFTGLTVAAGGYVLQNVVLLVAGTLVGASGTFLTLLMATRHGPLGDQHPVRRAQGRLDPRRRRPPRTDR